MLETYVNTGAQRKLPDYKCYLLLLEPHNLVTQDRLLPLLFFATIMVRRILRRIPHDVSFTKNLIWRQETYQWLVYGVLHRYWSQMLKMHQVEKNTLKEAKNIFNFCSRPSIEKRVDCNSRVLTCGSGDKYHTGSKWRFELTWFHKVLEPALQLCRSLSTGTLMEKKAHSTGRSLKEIMAFIQQSKMVIEGWSWSDLTMGLLLIYLRQSSLNSFEDVKGLLISSESTVQSLIYHIELAKGSYKDNASGLARSSMLRESNILKFVKDSSVMRPGYYIAIDPREKLIIFGIRGTHTIYDLITDIASSCDGDVTCEGYSTHFGTAEAARWFLTHEMETIRKCTEKYKGFRLRIVGHSLGGATASLLAIMLHQQSPEELGFAPSIVSAVGFATPPCVSKEVAENCSNFVTTVVMQDDIIPRLSAASLARLKNEILQTDWASVAEKEDWKNVVELVANAKQVVTSVQDVARKLVDYGSLWNKKYISSGAIDEGTASAIEKEEASCGVKEELFVPGTSYYLKREIGSSEKGKGAEEYFSLWKRFLGEHSQRIVLAGKIISDHKCDSHYYALRDVLKGLPSNQREEP